MMSTERQAHPATATATMRREAPEVYAAFRDGSLSMSEACSLHKRGVTTAEAVQRYRETGSVAQALVVERWQP